MHTLTIADFQKYVGLPANFDIKLLLPHQETAFRKKIHPYFSATVVEALSGSENEERKAIAELILKAAACYTVVVGLPFLKVKLSNAGIEQYDQDKVKNAPWWDIRDMGLSLVKIADEALSDALTAAGADPELRSEIDFFDKVSFLPIPTPGEFDAIYSINKSVDVYRLLVPIMQRVWRHNILAKIKGCTIEQLSEDENLSGLIREALAFYSLHYAMRLSQFTFITAGVVIQYDELPWQKSLLLDEKQKAALGDEFVQIAGDALSALLSYLKDHPDDFPCYEPEDRTFTRKIIEKKSGLYL